MNNQEPLYSISVNEAKKIIEENTNPLPRVLLPLEKAGNYILAEDILAPYNIPAFVQSSVDGYAFRFEDFAENRFLLQGESAAGNPLIELLQPKHCQRVFTGAPLPQGADTMVMQEKVSILEKVLEIRDPDIVKGNQVRAIGSEIEAGFLALSKGKPLGPASLGFLANIGVGEVWVQTKPRISLLITGNELQKPGLVLSPGQVYDSNSYSFNATLEHFHFPQAKIYFVNDNLDEISSLVQDCLLDSDIIVFTGGVSVGDYDFTLKSLQKNDFQILFHKVKQRPGKPLLFARKSNVLAFGLPGNPGAVLTCFYQYMVPCLEIASGSRGLVPRVRASLNHSFKKIKGLTFFLRGQFQDGGVTPLGGQESYKMGSYAEANCLIEMEEEREEFFEGEELNIYLLP